jgi:hypothetical protein
MARLRSECLEPKVAKLQVKWLLQRTCSLSCRGRGLLRPPHTTSLLSHPDLDIITIYGHYYHIRTLLPYTDIITIYGHYYHIRTLLPYTAITHQPPSRILTGCLLSNCHSKVRLEDELEQKEKSRRRAVHLEKEKSDRDVLLGENSYLTLFHANSLR